MTPLHRYAVVAIGAALGGMARYAVSGAAQRALGAALPYGTLVVNVAGCFVAGVVVTMLAARGGAGEGGRLLVVVGVLGGFTTFSAFGVETVLLWGRDEPYRALANVALNVGLGVAAVGVGRVVANTMGWG